MAPSLPNFFLIGAPKAGTTSLYHYLGQHPQIFMSPVKEPHYFSEEFRWEHFDEAMRKMAAPRIAALKKYLDGPVLETHFGGPIDNLDDYLKLFRRAAESKMRGEASVSYLWSPTAPRNIAALIPHAKLIAVLRNPAERAFSQYLHLLLLLPPTMSFREYVEAGMRADRQQIGPLHPFLELGKYAEHLDRYHEHFPREQMSILLYEDYQRDPAGMLQAIFRFLGVDAGFTPDMTQRHLISRVPRYRGINRVLQKLGLWQVARAMITPRMRRAGGRVLFRKPELVLDPRDRALLNDYYRDGIVRLEKLLERDVSGWLRA